jgi:hypothetical protein
MGSPERPAMATVSHFWPLATIPTMFLGPRLVPVEGGRWMWVGRDGSPVLNDRDFPSREVALAALNEAHREGRRRGMA